MKSLISGLLQGLLIVTASFWGTNAQNTQNNSLLKSFRYQDLLESTMAVEKSSFSIGTKMINTKAIRNFKKDFQNAEDVMWYQTDDGGYIAKFKSSGIANRVDYDRKGNCLAVSRYYSAAELPKDVRYQVKYTYIDFNIFTVVEISVGDKTAYYITLEGEYLWKKIIVVDRDIEETASYKKG